MGGSDPSGKSPLRSGSCFPLWLSSTFLVVQGAGQARAWGAALHHLPARDPVLPWERPQQPRASPPRAGPGTPPAPEGGHTLKAPEPNGNCFEEKGFMCKILIKKKLLKSSSLRWGWGGAPCPGGRGLQAGHRVTAVTRHPSTSASRGLFLRLLFMPGTSWPLPRLWAAPRIPFSA